MGDKGSDVNAHLAAGGRLSTQDAEVIGSEARGWERPIPFVELDVPGFPVEALPTWAGAYVSAVAVSTQTPVDLGSMLSLAVMATACGRKARVLLKEDWSEPLNLYLAVVLPSGEGKSPVFTALTAPVMAYEREQLERDRAERAERLALYDVAQRKLAAVQEAAAKGKATEAEVQQLAREVAGMEVPAPLRLLAEDCTPEKLSSLLRDQGGRLAVLSDEGGIFKVMAGRYSDGVPNIEVFKKAHSGGTLRVDRVGRPSEHIERPALTLGIAFQPDGLRRLHEKPELRGEGLLARLLYAIPKSAVGMRTFDTGSPAASVRVAYEEKVRAMLDWPMPDVAEGQSEHALQLALAARARLLEFRQWLEPQLGPGGELHALTDWANKLTGAVARIAGLLHLADLAGSQQPEKKPITVETVDRALAIGRYLIPHAKAAFDVMGADAAIGGAKRVLQWIVRSRLQSFTRRDAHRALQAHFKKAAELEPPLRLLEERHYIRRLEGAHRSSPGRSPSPEYEVNPLDRIDAIDGMPPRSTASASSVDSVNSVLGGSLPRSTDADCEVSR